LAAKESAFSLLATSQQSQLSQHTPFKYTKGPNNIVATTRHSRQWQIRRFPL